MKKKCFTVKLAYHVHSVSVMQRVMQSGKLVRQKVSKEAVGEEVSRIGCGAWNVRPKFTISFFLHERTFSKRGCNWTRGALCATLCSKMESTCWWTERNKANHGEQRLTPEELAFIVGRHTGEWAEFLKKPTTDKRVGKWNPPAEEWTKINLDGAFHPSVERGGWGCLAQDHENKLVFTGAGAIADAGKAIATESEALLQCMLIAELFTRLPSLAKCNHINRL
jgi:hypothetical protein